MPVDDAGSIPQASTPSPGLGVLYGRLIDELGSPVSRFTVFLAVIWPLETETGTTDVLLIDTVQAPRAESDDDGFFAFVDVEPGVYGIHYGYPGDVGAGFVRDVETQDALLYDIRTDSVQDVGDIVRRVPAAGGS